MDLFLAHHQFSVQVHRPRTWFDVGAFDESFGLCYCEDDDYALRMTAAGRVYERFAELDPTPGSITERTIKPQSFAAAKQRFVAKWGCDFYVNLRRCPAYATNRAFARDWLAGDGRPAPAIRTASRIG